MEILVKSCQACPFCNNDNEYGNDSCNAKEIKTKDFEQLPSDKVHDDCPLKGNEITIKLWK